MTVVNCIDLIYGDWNIMEVVDRNRNICAVDVIPASKGMEMLYVYPPYCI